jgi:hypothetical protein
MNDRVTVRTQMCVPIIPNCDSVNLQNVRATLTFEEGTWFLDVTQRYEMVNICAKLFQNPSVHDKVTVWTRLLCKWGRTDRQTARSISRF